MFFGNPKLDKLEEFLAQFIELISGKRNVLTLPPIEGSDRVSMLLRDLEKAAELYIKQSRQDMQEPERWCFWPQRLRQETITVESAQNPILRKYKFYQKQSIKCWTQYPVA
jgi:hypothetical protein